METCVKCGKEHPKIIQDFLIVERKTESNLGWTNTTEQLTGAERHAVCTKCLFNSVAKRASIRVIVGAVLIFLAIVILVGNDVSSQIGRVAVVSLALGIIIGLLTLSVGMHSNIHKAGYMEEIVWEQRGNSSTNKIFIPVGENLYKSEEIFLHRNKKLITDIKKKIYSELIATGAWKNIVASQVSNTNKETAPDSAADLPLDEHQTLLLQCVKELLQLYQQSPGGILTFSAAAMPVREIGKKLDEAGGFQMMLEAHALFSEYNSGIGLARNLEMVWDGIGNWRG